MANIVILGGGFGGVVTAESVAKRIGQKHKITLVSRNRKFIFQPALVRYAFGRCRLEDIEFDVREALSDHRINFVEGEVARVSPTDKQISFDRGDLVGNMPYDFLILALGRRLRTELVAGFVENANHLLGKRAATKCSEAVRDFHKGQAVIGYCAGARLPIPLFETAFELSRTLEERGERAACSLSIICGENLDDLFGGVPLSDTLLSLLKSHGIELISDFVISRITPNCIASTDGRAINYELNMVIPPFGGPNALFGTNMIDHNGYVRVDPSMRARGVEHIYAVGDCVSLRGPKMAHMAVRQAEVAAENLAAELNGKEATAEYDHEMMLVIDTGGSDSTFVQKELGQATPLEISQSRFWGWAKRRQENYWKARHA